MSDIVPIIEDYEVPEDWDYDAAVERIGQMKGRVMKAMGALAREVWVAYHKLDHAPGRRADPELPSFAGFLRDAGISKTTGYRIIREYDPAIGQRQVVYLPEIENAEHAKYTKRANDDLELPDAVWIATDGPFWYDFERPLTAKYVRADDAP
jgi:hypothetical protein